MHRAWAQLTGISSMVLRFIWGDMLAGLWSLKSMAGVTIRQLSLRAPGWKGTVKCPFSCANVLRLALTASNDRGSEQGLHTEGSTALSIPYSLHVHSLSSMCLDWLLEPPHPHRYYKLSQITHRSTLDTAACGVSDCLGIAHTKWQWREHTKAVYGHLYIEGAGRWHLGTISCCHVCEHSTPSMALYNGGHTHFHQLYLSSLIHRQPSIIHL